MDATPGNVTRKPIQMEKPRKDGIPRRPYFLSAAYNFFCHYLTDQCRETIGPFSFPANKKDIQTLTFSFPVRDLSQKLEYDLRHVRDYLKALRTRAPTVHIAQDDGEAQSGNQQSTFDAEIDQSGKADWVGTVRHELVWRRREMQHLRKAVAEAKNAVEMKLQEWVEAQRIIENMLTGLEGTLATIDGLTEREQGAA